jgi:hypothetical protein
VADGNGGVLVEEQHGGGLADDVAAANDDGVLASDGDVAALEDLDDTCRRARGKSGAASLQAAGVDGMKAVNILCWVDRIQQGLGVNLGGEWKLDEDTVDIVTGVESGNEVKHFPGGDGVWRREEIAENAEFGAGLYLAADVNFRGGDIADQHRCQTGTDALSGERADLLSDFLFDGGGNSCAVEYD